MVELGSSAQHGCGRNDFARPATGPRRRRWTLLAGAATAALLAAAGGASANDLTYIGPAVDVWGNAANWTTTAIPTANDTVTIDNGDVAIGATAAAGTINISDGGILRAGHSADLSASVINVTGGELRASAGSKQPIGVINIGSQLNVSGGTITIGGALHVASGGSIVQSGGTVLSGFVDPSTAFFIDTPQYTQTGGSFIAMLSTQTYTQTGGTIGGIVNTGVYDLTDAAATSTGSRINASSLFTLRPTQGLALVEAYLSGSGRLVKSGDSTVMLTSSNNDFTGGVAIEAGVLEVEDDALPDAAEVSISDGATLQMDSSEDTATVFMGTLTGAGGALVKDGLGTLTLGGEIYLGGLSVNGGTLNIGTGTSTDTASFESATIDSGATLYVAKNATLTIRVPNNIVNNGHLINDGTVNDDLDNSSTFDNNSAYNANVASNTGTINNNSPGVWTGNVLSNNSQIANGSGAHWIGNIVGNSNAIINAQGGTWSGHVLANSGNVPAGQIINYGTWINGIIEGNTGMIFNVKGSWTGDVRGNSDFISNNTNDATSNPGGINHAQWTGDIVGNSGTVTNDLGGTWTGGIKGNRATINNNGTWSNGTISGNGVNGGPSGLYANGVINNTSTGIWSGNIAGNYGWIYNQGGRWTGSVLGNSGQVWNDNRPDETGTGYWIGDVAGNGGMVFNGGGGDWTGNVLGNGLAGYIKNDTLGLWHGQVRGNDGRIENGGTWGGDLTGNAGLVFNEGVWTGDVVAANTSSGNTGTIYNATSAAKWNGDVKDNTGTIDNRGGWWNGAVTANTGTIFNRAATWNDDPTGDSKWTGDVASNAGTIVNGPGSTWTGNVVSNAGTITSSSRWTGSFTSAGIVNAMGEIDGAFNNSGLLHLSGSLTGITTLSNLGILDMRGSSAGQTLTATSASFGSGSSYEVSVDSEGHADRLVATSATLGGTVRVTARPTGGSYSYMTPYTILTAGSISGVFGGVTTDLAFLDPQLDYLTPGSVKLDLVRNNMGFEQAGVSANQKAAAARAQSLGAGNPIYDAILWLNADEAQQAFDALSGEAYASVANASVQNAGIIADIATGRIDQAFDAVGGGDASVSAYADGPALASGPSLSNGLWWQFYGAHGSVAPGGGFSGVESTTGGFAAGVDGLLDDWRVGVMAQAGATGTVVAGLNSFSTSIDYGLGVYGGREWGDTRLALGATFTRHDISANRQVVFPGFADTLTAQYAAGTSQAFAQLSHKFNLGAVALTPYASLAYVSHATDGFTESGGAAALTSTANVIDATFATLGLGADRQFVVGDDMLLTAKGAVGWRHAFSDAAGATHTLAGGTSFAVLGAPIVADMFVLNAGLSLDVSPTTTLELRYDGQLGGGTQTHALKATWTGNF